MQEISVPKPARDLELWDVLHQETSPENLVSAIGELAAVEDASLFTMLCGPLATLAAHEDARVRAACAAALARASGHDGASALARLLDDDNSGVRLAAADAAAGHGAVLAALALLHRRADVRHALIAHKTGFPWDDAALLLADPGDAERVRARLTRDAQEPRVARTVLRAFAIGLMPREEARARLEDLAWDTPQAIVASLRFTFSVNDKDLETPAAIDAALARPWMRDSLTEIFDLCATRDGALDDDTPFCRALVRACQRGHIEAFTHRRVALTILLKALTLGACPPRLLAVAFAVSPGALELRLPAEQRRRALAACVDVLPLEQAGKAKLTALPKDLLIEDGVHHLRASAGAMRLLSADPYRALVALEPDRARLLAAIERSPRDAAALLSLPARSAPDKAVLDELVPRVLALPMPPRALGALVLALPHQSLGSVDQLERTRAGLAEECVMAIVDALAHAPRKPPDTAGASDDDALEDAQLEQRLQRAGGALAKQLRAEVLPRLIADLVTHPGAARGRAAPLVAALVRAAGPAHARDIVLACRPSGERALLDALDDLSMSARLERAFAASLHDSPDARARLGPRAPRKEERAAFAGGRQRARAARRRR